jgi:glycosyltransferase involved in cell wall biosynthesis
MLSIIITTFNDSEELVQTIASCLIQDVKPEIIVVDDASTKPMDDVTRQFVQLFCTFIVNEHNLGLAEARDEGIKVANGEYILPLDCGDWLYPHVLGKMEAAMDGATVVYGNMDEKDDGKFYVPPGYWFGVTKKGMLRLNQLWCTSLFRRSLWEKVGGYKTGLHISYEDYTFWNKCLMAGAIFKYIPLLIYRHTYNPNSMLNQLHKNTDYFNELARKPLYE